MNKSRKSFLEVKNTKPDVIITILSIYFFFKSRNVMPPQCFVCNLPILSHQVGLRWQGGSGVDDLLREQINMVSKMFIFGENWWNERSFLYI